MKIKLKVNLNSMTRSLWKGPFCEIREKQEKIWSRRSVILPKLVGKQYFIYNGKIFISLKVTEDMVGHKFGEFASTRKKTFHKIKGKK
jgi:small subunit ribosomal protein S19